MKGRMKILAACALLAFAAVAHAQRADCPHLDAPPPNRPPGEPPPLLPPVSFPQRLEDGVKAPQSHELSRDEVPAAAMKEWDRRVEKERANDWLLEAEEGHVAMVARASRGAQLSPPPPGLASAASDIASSPLASWTYLGFSPAGPHHLRRYWRAGDGSIIEMDELDLEATGGAVITLPGMHNARVNERPATMSGLRSPSGCIQSSLAWYDQRKSYALRLAGPLDLQRQRAVLMEVAQSIAPR
jgi:hypothetical protein